MLERTFSMKELIATTATTATLAAMGATPAQADTTRAAVAEEHHIVVTRRGPQARAGCKSGAVHAARLSPAMWSGFHPGSSIGTGQTRRPRCPTSRFRSH